VLAPASRPVRISASFAITARELFLLLRQQREEFNEIFAGMKYVLPVVAARDHMIQTTLDLNPRPSRHTRQILHQKGENRRIASLKTVLVSRQSTSVPPYWAVGLAGSLTRQDSLTVQCLCLKRGFRRTEQSTRGSLIHLYGHCKETRVIDFLIAHDVWIRTSRWRFERTMTRRLAWLYQAAVISDRAILRALPTVRPRWSNSSAVILSRSIIESLTKSFLEAAVLATAFGFFFVSRL